MLALSKKVVLRHNYNYDTTIALPVHELSFITIPPL